MPLAGKSSYQSWHGRKASNVLIFDAALPDVFALCIAGKEASVVFFKVGVAVPAGGEHFLDVEIEPCFLRVVASLGDLMVEKSGELEVCRVFSSGKVLVVVNMALAPEGCLVM